LVIKVAINGYGTIGKRIAEALYRHPGLDVIGIAKINLDYSINLALKKKFRIYTVKDNIEKFRSAGYQVHGSIEDMVSEADVVIDATPAGLGARYKDVYVKYRKPVIFQGGEDPSVAELSFSTLCNYEDALGVSSLRVVSCNTTGVLRVICLLDREFGVEKARVVIIRRGADPREDARGPINSLKLDSISIPSHHALDAKLVKPGLDIETYALVASTTLMHIQVLFIKLKESVSKDKFLNVFEKVRRFILIDAIRTGIDSTSKIIELARDLGRFRNDIPENVLWINTLKVEDKEVSFIQAIHQESIVIPENIDAIKAMFELERDLWSAVSSTDQYLNLGLRLFDKEYN